MCLVAQPYRNRKPVRGPAPKFATDQPIAKDGPALEPVPAEAVHKFVWLLSERDDFYYLDAQVGDNVEEGQFLGRVTDFEGKVLQNMVAPAAGDILFLVSTLAINKGDTLVAVGA